MGLDISLYKYNTPIEKIEKREKDAHETSENIYRGLLRRYGVSSLDDLPEEKRGEFDDEKERLYRAADLDEWGEAREGNDHVEGIEIPSKVHPDHLFKIGYFRSSYNDGGFNTIMRKLIGTDLYVVFAEADNEHYRLKVDWHAALERAREGRDKYEQYLKEMGPFEVIDFAMNPFTKPDSAVTSSKQAVDIFKIQTKRWANDDGGKHPMMTGWYSGGGTADGTFMQHDPPTLRGIIIGVQNGFGDRVVPCAYVLIDKREEEDADGVDFYLGAWQIIVETIEWVLGQDEPEKFLLHWSG